MAVNKIAESKCHPDLVKERRAASFDVNEVTELLHFGKAMNERRRELIWQALKEDVIREGPPHAFLSQEQAYSNAIHRSAVYMKKLEELDITLDNEKATFRQIMLPFGPFPLALHISMFVNALETQTTKEQKAKWLPLAQSNKIIGTYAQTELGHGTFLRALETMATYDPANEEFIIHSPTTTSMKWWPGGLGKTANHVILMAQLFVKGVNHGMHSFIVPIRDLETHEPLPGITVGDIGPKFGYNVMDNGFLKFDHYRIPRENMLMKNAEVTKTGEYVSKASKKLTYGAMVFIRTSIVYVEAARSLSEACTIAIRYSCVRRQSEMKPGAPEPQILDYQTQQYKLLPQLAASYAYWFSGIQLFQMYFAFMADAQTGNNEGLPELHALSSGLKAFCSWGAMWGVEQCRLSCGGHGFSMASGIPSIYGNVATPACTYEGENTVMMLQMARYLVKIVESGQPNSSHASYLAEKHFDKCVISDQCDLPSLLAAYRSRASRQVKEAVQRLNKFRSSGKEHYDAWNLTSVDLVAAVTAHCHYVVTKSFADAIEQSTVGDAARQVLTQLCQLYATYGIVENHGHFLQGGFMTEEQLQCVRNKLFSLLADLRPNAVALVDAFDYHDETLQSCLGRYDGHVYESLYEWAKNSPLNKTQVHESFHKYLKPMLQGANSKL